jgi:hypothetical protein
MTKTVSCRLTTGEWLAFQQICEKHNVSYQELFHSIIIDALVEEGYDALRCKQQEGREGSGEASETCGATTP